VFSLGTSNVKGEIEQKVWRLGGIKDIHFTLKGISLCECTSPEPFCVVSRGLPSL